METEEIPRRVRGFREFSQTNEGNRIGEALAGFCRKCGGLNFRNVAGIFGNHLHGFLGDAVRERSDRFVRASRISGMFSGIGEKAFRRDRGERSEVLGMATRRRAGMPGLL